MAVETIGPENWAHVRFEIYRRLFGRKRNIDGSGRANELSGEECQPDDVSLHGASEGECEFTCEQSCEAGTVGGVVIYGVSSLFANYTRHAKLRVYPGNRQCQARRYLSC